METRITFKESFVKRISVALHLLISSEIVGRDVKVFYNGSEITPAKPERGRNDIEKIN